MFTGIWSGREGSEWKRTGQAGMVVERHKQVQVPLETAVGFSYILGLEGEPCGLAWAS